MKTLYEFILERQNTSPILAAQVFKIIEDNLERSGITKTNSGWRRNSHPNEVLIGNLGSDDDEIITNIKDLLKNSGFKSTDYKIDGIDIWGKKGFDTSRSKLSVKVDIKKIDGEKKNEPVFFCLGSSTESYLSKGSNHLTPMGLKCDGDFMTVDNLIKLVQKNIPKVLPEGTKKKETSIYLNDILNDLDEFGGYPSYQDYSGLSNLKLDIPFKTKINLDATTNNTINTTFGEVCSGIILAKIMDSDVMFPADHSYAINDLILSKSDTPESEPNLCGVSVKKGSGVSHAPEFDMIAKMFLKDGGLEKLELDGEDATEMEEFSKHLLPIFASDDKGKRESILWNTCFKMFTGGILESDFEFDKYFKKLIELIGIDSSTPIKDIKSICIGCFNEPGNYNNFKTQILTPVLSIMGLKGPQDDWSTGAKKDLANYSKIMHLLQFMVVYEMNKHYSKSLNNIVCYILNSIQIYCDINIKKNLISFKTIKMDEKEYEFSCAGATWNEWNTHGSLMVRPK